MNADGIEVNLATRCPGAVGGRTERAGLELLARLASHGVARPDSPALTEIGPGARGITVSYSDLDAAVREFAASVRRDIPPGGVMLLCCPNRAEFVVAFLGVLAAGRTVMPLPPAIGERELTEVIQATSAAAMIGGPRAGTGFPAAGLRRIDLQTIPLRGHSGTPCWIRFGEPGYPATEEPTLLLQSSGTTGLPKIAVRPGPSLDAVGANVARSIGLTPADRVLGVVPLCHSYGVENGLLGPIYAGSCVHLCDGFDLPTVLGALLKEDGATVFPGVPFMFEMLARALPPQRLGGAAALRAAYSAGAPMPPAVHALFAERLGVTPGQLYGATEIGSVTFGDPGDAGYDPRTVGRPVHGVRVLILDPDGPDPACPLGVGDEGHVAVSAPSMFSGYLDGPGPVVDGFFLTGDLGRLDRSGRLTITGRLKLLIDVGGMKVNPAEVESAISEHPGVAECVVVPVRVTETVSRLKAIVTRCADGSAERATPESLRAFARSRLTGHKVPRLFEIRDSLPKSATGKVLRRQLEAMP